MTKKSIFLGLAILTLSTSVALAAHHRAHHHNVTNANTDVAAPPVVPPGVNSSDHATYLRNLHDSGYDPKNDYANGVLKTQ
ncbi:hypothetical protein [Bradyrhizobium lablabi]|uniref:hypothetical protein n=1 Tax=Bradyrhizobium lablabi TaxID=722472 RepID=UPI001BA4F365|nr:hypothetical protein [Bradyrhizobium lablabi]MBR0695115.1 hypothetical protein [Bradyrhizobium lablabi]